jgi:hypothetical protein
MNRREFLKVIGFFTMAKGLKVERREAPKLLEPIGVSLDGKSFQMRQSGKHFVPWGFNYDHDENGRLIEDFWETEWSKVEEDFQEMKALGANVVRIHLQFGKFMNGLDKPNRKALDRLRKLVELAERLKVYLDITGLGCYRKDEVPSWYDNLSDEDRWKAQGVFWEAVASVCADSPAVFCYNLMNEPLVPGEEEKRSDWLGFPFEGMHWTQYIALTTKGRKRAEIARDWIRYLLTAIRRHDEHHLVTVGLVSWSLEGPGRHGFTSGFEPKQVSEDLDFVSVHIYPGEGKVDEALETLKGFSVGKPILVEEVFPLRCSVKELEEFIERSKGIAAGWLGFYWGKTPDECLKGGSIRDQLMFEWLELFQRKYRQGITSSNSSRS